MALQLQLRRPGVRSPAFAALLLLAAVSSAGRAQVPSEEEQLPADEWHHVDYQDPISQKAEDFTVYHVASYNIVLGIRCANKEATVLFAVQDPSYQSELGNEDWAFATYRIGQQRLREKMPWPYQPEEGLAVATEGTKESIHIIDAILAASSEGTMGFRIENAHSEHVVEFEIPLQGAGRAIEALSCVGTSPRLRGGRNS